MTRWQYGVREPGRRDKWYSGPASLDGAWDQVARTNRPDVAIIRREAFVDDSPTEVFLAGTGLALEATARTVGVTRLMEHAERSGKVAALRAARTAIQAGEVNPTMFAVARYLGERADEIEQDTPAAAWAPEGVVR